jgi:membrane protease YdiL (CAAX protease family)
MMSLDLSNDSIYSDELRQNITYGTLFAPLMEELLFRGILQPLLLLMIGALFSLSLTELFSETTFELFSFLVCCTLLDMLKFGILLLLIAVILPVLPQVLTIAGFGAGINAASIGAVCATAILFGAIHLPNAHDLSGLQAINATLFGVALGLLALQYGLWVPIAAHIMNNTLATIHLFLEDEFELQKQPESMMAPSIA